MVSSVDMHEFIQGVIDVHVDNTECENMMVVNRETVYEVQGCY